MDCAVTPSWMNAEMWPESSAEIADALLRWRAASDSRKTPSLVRARRPAGRQRAASHRELNISPETSFASKTTANKGRDDANIILFQPEDFEQTLPAVPAVNWLVSYTVSFFVAIPHGDRRMRLNRIVIVGRRGEFQVHAMRCGLEAASASPLLTSGSSPIMCFGFFALGIASSNEFIPCSAA